MSDARQAKHWKVVEVQLRQASELLDDPGTFGIEERPLDGYRAYLDDGTFEKAMGELAGLATEAGCRPGFWRRLKQVADQLGLKEKANEYERQFHQSLRSIAK